MDFNPYKVLNVDQGADPEFITNAYRYLSKKFHPDVNKTDEAATKMRDINRAYEILKDPEQRRKLDEQLSRASSSGPSSRPRSGSGGFTSDTYTRSGPPPRYSTYQPPRPSARSSSSSNPADTLREWTQRWTHRPQEEARPTPPADKTLYLFKRSLVDDTNQKTLRISVYYETARGNKICEIFSSAPDVKGKLLSGSVYFHSEQLFDFVTDLEEGVKAFDDPSSPIEMQADHAVYWRRSVKGLSKTFLGLEIIKGNRSSSKEALLLLGGKTAQGGIEGVAARQTAKQLQQISKIMVEALAAMRS